MGSRYHFGTTYTVTSWYGPDSGPFSRYWDEILDSLWSAYLDRECTCQDARKAVSPVEVRILSGGGGDDERGVDSIFTQPRIEHNMH